MSRIEVAEVMLAVLGALQATRWALASIKRGDDPQENIDILAKEVEALNADGRISQAGGRRMAIDESMKPQWERERKERGRDLEQAQTLQSGGGGGTYDGMEARVAKLESGVDEIKIGRAHV